MRIHIIGGLKARPHNDPVKALGIVHPILPDASRQEQDYSILFEVLVLVDEATAHLLLPKLACGKRKQVKLYCTVTQP